YGIKWFKRLITNFSMPTDNIVLFSFIIKPLEFAKKLGYSREIEYSGKAIILPNPEDGNPEVTLVRYFERKTNLWEKTDFIKYKHNAWYLSTKFDKPNIESFTIDIKDTFKEEIKNVRKEYQQYSPKITQVLREATLESLKYDSFIKHLYKIIYNNDRKDLDYYKIGTDIFRNIGNKGLKRLSVTQLENNMSIISNAFLKSDTIQCEKMMEGEVDFDVFDNLDIEDVRKFYDISIKATIAELEDNPPVIIISKAQKTASEKALLQALNNNFTQGEIERLRRILKKEPMYYDNYCSLIARFYNTILQINMPEKEWVLRSIF
ncbi:MAG: hypothetical protein AB2799_02375, partial [Candidatus Thiodiazotropha sp.]